MPESLETLRATMRETVAPDIYPLVDRRDGAAQLLAVLPTTYTPEMLSGPGRERAERAWELLGLYYFNSQRPYEALSILDALYRQLLLAQVAGGRWLHKGTPLVWMADCYTSLRFPSHARRHLMLTLCEDAVRGEGRVSPEASGIYFRLVWHYGLADAELQRYASQIARAALREPTMCMYPEWLLQQLDQNWIVEPPMARETGLYAVNRMYVEYLLARIGDGSGRTLELLAEYLLSCMPGCRTSRRRQSSSTDYDIVCSVEGLELDFRSEFGRYFVCECKDWSRPADFTTMAKFCRVLDSTKARFGILFSRNGVSGVGSTRFAEREQLKVFQDRGLVIVVVDEQDLREVSRGANFTRILRDKYERVRLDLREATPLVDES